MKLLPSLSSNSFISLWEWEMKWKVWLKAEEAAQSNEWMKLNWKFNWMVSFAAEDNGKDGWAVCFEFGLVMGGTAARQQAKREDEQSSAMSFNLSFSLLLKKRNKSKEKEERAESEKTTTNKGKEPAHWVCEVVGYELAAPPPTAIEFTSEFMGLWLLSLLLSSLRCLSFHFIN